MATTVSNGTTTITVEGLDGWDSSRAGGNVIHPIVNSPAPSVSDRPASLRTGRHRFIVPELEDALELESMLAAIGTFTLNDSNVSAVAMTFKLAGRLAVYTDPGSSGKFVVDCEYAEVTS